MAVLGGASLNNVHQQHARAAVGYWWHRTHAGAVSRPTPSG